MVSSGTGRNAAKPSQGVLYLLQRSGLMANAQYEYNSVVTLYPLTNKGPYSGSSLQITSSGFQFLLHNPHAQLWELLLQYLRMAEVRNNAVY